MAFGQVQPFKLYWVCESITKQKKERKKKKKNLKKGC